MWIFQQNANSKQRSVCLMENVPRESNQLTSPITESVFSFPCFKRKCTNFFLTVGKRNILLIRSEARCKGLNVRRNRSSSAFSSVKRFTSAYATAPPTPPPPPPAQIWIMSTAISRKVVGKNVHVTISQGNMGYDQHCSWHCGCRTYFCCFPFGADHLTLNMGDFSIEKKSLEGWFRRKKNSWKEIPGEKISFMT